MPTRLQNLIGRGIDLIAKGNNYNPQTGQYNNVGRGLLARAGQVGATVLGGPLAGAAVGQAGNNWVNNGNPLDFSGNDSRLGQLVNAFAGNNNGPQREQFGVDTSLDVSDIAQQIGIQPNLQTGGEPPSAADRMATKLQRIQDQINQQGVATTRPVNVRPIGGQLNFGGGRGGYNNGVGAGTGFGASSFTNDGFGDVAAGFGVGSANSGFANRATGADARGFKMTR